MDAARLVTEAERVMRGAPQPEQVIAEAWQAYELAQALGLLLGHQGLEVVTDGAADGGVEGAGGGVQGDARPPGHQERPRPAARGGPSSMVAVTGAGPPRAARLTGVRDPAGTLRALRVLLGEIGLALVDVTCTAEDESGYWLCIDALDAVDEAKERVGELADAVRGQGSARGGG
jgi:hypothetical protein